MKVTFISTVPASSLSQVALDLKREFDLPLELKIYYPRQIDEEDVDEKLLLEELKRSDAVFIDIRGEGRASDVVYDALKAEKNIVVNLSSPFSKIMKITRLGTFSGSEMADRIKPGAIRDPEEVWKKLHLESAAKSVSAGPMKDVQSFVKIARYWRHGGRENYRNLLLYFMKEYLECDLPEAKDPLQFPEYGIYHPIHGSFDDLDAFLKCSSFSDSRPTIGVLFYGNMHFDQCQSTLKALSEKLGDVNLIPVFSDGIHNLQAMRKFFFKDDRPILDALVNLTWFRMNGGPLGGNHTLTRELLKDLNVPVFTPAPMYSREVEKWLESPTGLSAPEVIMAVIWPELDGCIEPIPCCGVQSFKIGDIDAQDVIPIDDRICRIASRIKNWNRLRKMPHNQKKVAIIIYNYPPGEANLGRASYLDVFKSVGKLLEKMAEEGYRIDLPEKDLHLLFQDFSIVNSGTWLQKQDTLKSCHYLNVEDYKKFFSSMPGMMRSDMIDSWGEPPGDVMNLGDKILIPGIEFGNVFVGIQPARPPLKDQDLASATHDKTKPPHHQYVAFYKWLQEVWKADLVIHVGTHGLAEFMKGKEVGMSNLCFPDLLIGDLPHLYFYHIVNTSEVVIAKRRLYGTIIGYNSPPYTVSDLYEEYAVLQDLIDEYSESRVQDPIRCERVKELILDKAKELNFESEDVDILHDQLYEMKRRIIPDGLHVLGEEYDLSVMKQFVVFLLRYDREGIKSINRILAESAGIDYDFALRNRARFAAKLESIDEECTRIVEICIQRAPETAAEESDLADGEKKELLKTLNYGLSLMKNYSQNQGELTNFCRGLGSEFIEQGDGGDVIRSPEVLPTGRNLTQFDPTKIPTPAAFERGAEIAQNTISKYLERKSTYPETTGVILWGFETTKTGGESIGQILSYLGVKIERPPGALAYHLSVVPLEEMGRPRIDCLVNICGFFRDMFPNVVELLDQAFNLVAELNEPLIMNYIRKHSLENLERLQSEKENDPGQDFDHKTLRKIANGRVFGPRAGEYGTRTLPLVEDSIWKTEDELAEVYIQSMNHLYAKNLHAVKSDAIYRSNLARVDLVSQVRDTQDREIIDLDHYFEYFGGLSNAVRTARGERPKMLISDTTGEVIQTEDVRDVVTRGVRTRLLNPKWIEGMLKHECHGAQQVAERLENVLGLAATTHSVENWIWSAIAKRYIFDQEMQERLMKNNPYAAAEVAERLVEAEKRGYWQSTEQEKNLLRLAYLNMEGRIEENLNK